MTTLIGLEPESTFGVEFHRTTYAWHPLWDYCDDRHPDITDRVDYPYEEYADGLEADDARLLAQRLFDDINSGAADDYVFARNAIISALSDGPCNSCDGTGIRTDEVGKTLRMHLLELRADQVVRLGRQRGWCNECFGEGSVLAREKSYTFQVSDIAEFARFLQSCGGFEIQ